MSKLMWNGMDDYLKSIGKIYDDADRNIKGAVYESSGVVADAVREEIKNIPASANLKPWERQGLLDGLGISHMDTDDGETNVRIGFSGYAEHSKGRTAVPLIARAVTAGTSFRERYPFVQRAASRVKNQAIKTMKEPVERGFEEAI